MKSIPATACALFIIFLSLQSSAQNYCPPASTTRVMLLGDSWTNIMWNNRTYKDVFDQFGYADITERGDYTAIAGTTASYWADPGNIALITNDLLANPSIDIVLFSIGGNDLLAGANGSIPGWHTGLDITQESALFDMIQTNIQTIINAIENVRPDIEIVFSGYDFVNFVETVINNPGGSNALEWLNLGQPSAAALNAAFSRMEQRKINIANADPRVYYVNGMGLMQYIYGYPSYFLPQTVALPGQVPPTYAPFPGGDINFPTPPEALAGNGTDAIHLSDEGYRHLVVNQTVNYFYPKFRGSPDATFISEGQLNDGWVKDDNTTGTTAVRVGDDNSGNSYHGVFSFNTSSLPDNISITGASLYINRSGAAGNNPFTTGILGNPVVDVKNGTFGNEYIEPTDILQPADAADAGCFTGTALDNGYTVRIDLEPAGCSQINLSGKTQFRVYFQNPNNFIDDYLIFYNGDQPAPLSPFLDVFYSVITSAPSNLNSKTLVISPNPLSEQATIFLPEENSGEMKLSVYDINGRRISQLMVNCTDSKIFFERNELKAGLYFVELSAKETFRGKLMIVD